MNGGKLTAKIQFLERELVRDGAGGFETDKPATLILETWSSVRQIKASRTAENLQEGINSVYEVRLRQRSNFKPKITYFVAWNNEFYNITSIEADLSPRKEWVLIITGRGTGL